MNETSSPHKMLFIKDAGKLNLGTSKHPKSREWSKATALGVLQSATTYPTGGHVQKKTLPATACRGAESLGFNDTSLWRRGMSDTSLWRRGMSDRVIL